MTCPYRRTKHAHASRAKNKNYTHCGSDKFEGRLCLKSLLFNRAGENVYVHIPRRPCCALPYVYGAIFSAVSPPDTARIQTTVHATATAANDPSVRMTRPTPAISGISSPARSNVSKFPRSCNGFSKWTSRVCLSCVHKARNLRNGHAGRSIHPIT